MKKFERILVVRTDRIGDVVLTLPLAEILKKHFPETRVAFLLRKYTAPLAHGDPFIDNVLLLPEEKNKVKFFQLLSLLKENKFDAAVVVHPRFKISLAIFLAGIKTRVGTAYRWYSFLFNKKVRQHRRKGEFHELEYNVHLLTALGISEKVTKETVRFNVQVNPESKRRVTDYLISKGWQANRKTVLFHPGSGKSALDLPLSKFKEILSHLAQELNLNLILTGSKEEKEMCKALEVNGKTINTAGDFSLEDLIALISLSDLVIANSTGPIHIAAALGKKTIGFYPNVQECSPKRWGPYSENAFVFVPKVDCGSCDERKQKHNCMEEIESEKVVLKIKEILNAEN